MRDTMLALCIAACTAAAARRASAEERRYACPALSREPAIDGKVEGDAGWKETAAEERFFKFGSNEAPSRKTRFRMGCTDEALFIGVECEEPETGKLRASSPDMGELWTEDSVEIFILPRGSDAYYQFIVNAAGSRWNGIRGVNGVDLPLQDWQAKTLAAGGAWSVEMRIPWKVIKYVPGKGEEWGLNVCRNIVGAVDGTENVTWAHMKASFHEPESFGKLVFARKVSPKGWERRRERARRPREKAKVLVYSRPLGRKGKLGTFLQEGAAKRRISFIQGAHVAPRLSPDGKGVLLHSNEGGRLGIWLTDRKGAEMRRVCDGSHAEWSPDGGRMVFAREGKIVEREIASGKEKVLSPKGLSPCLFASYVSDGTILFVRREGEREELYLADPKGGLPCILTAGDILSTPKSSPDGKRIAYQDGAHLHLFDVESCTSTQLTLAGGVQSWPVWSSDGTTVYYCQRAEPYDEVGEVHAVAVDSPGVAGLIQKDVNASFDWNGFVDGPVKRHRLAGASLEVPRGDSRSDQPLVVKNDWFTLRGPVDDRKVLIIPQEGGASGSPVEIEVVGDGVRIDSIALVKHGADHAQLKARFVSKGGEPTEVMFTVHRTSPVVEIRPVDKAATIRITALMSAVVVPDRYSNDLLLEPEAFKDSSRMALPRAPFVLGCTRDGGILVAPLDGQDVTVVKDMQGNAFKGLEVRGRVILSLAERPVWQQVEVKPADEGKWDIQWAAPFPAQWRFAAAGGGAYHSRMWEGPAPVKGFAGPPRSCVMYLYGRTGETPLKVRTPVDILRDALGTRGCEKLLDIEGVRGFRSADEPVPFLEIFTRPHGWSPTLVHTKPGDLGILETMMGIGGADIEPVRSLVRHLGDDIINLLGGLDGRTKEYETFLTELRRHCRGGGTFETRVVGQMEELQKSLAGLKVTALENVRGAVDDLVKKGVKRGTWTNFHKEYKDLSSLSRAALSDRQKVLDAYREFAKHVRDLAARKIIYTPQLKNRYEALREMTRNVLRNRYYLEGDWRGEKPLRGGVR